MRLTSSLMQAALCLSSLAPLASAWPGGQPDGDTHVIRAEQSGDKQTTTGTKDNTKSTATTGGAASKETATKTKSGNSSKGSDLNTAKPKTGKETGKETGTATDKNDKSKVTHTTFAPDAPAGAVSMITPNTVVQATPLFKIGDYVTLGWNYTDLLGPPSAIDVLLSCSTATETWTLTSNMTFETAVSYVWDSSKQEHEPGSPLLTAMYTLIVKDSDAEITDLPQPGYLGSYSGFKFGMYAGQDYESLKTWKCPGGCSAASIDRHAIGFVLTMSVVTVLSFTWFVSGLGLH